MIEILFWPLIRLAALCVVAATVGVAIGIAFMLKGEAK